MVNLVGPSVGLLSVDVTAQGFPIPAPKRHHLHMAAMLKLGSVTLWYVAIHPPSSASYGQPPRTATRHSTSSPKSSGAGGGTQSIGLQVSASLCFSGSRFNFPKLFRVAVQPNETKETSGSDTNSLLFLKSETSSRKEPQKGTMHAVYVAFLSPTCQRLVSTLNTHTPLSKNPFTR